MAVIIEANYSKKVGLPNFSSHQYSVTLRTELSDLSQLEKANAELYSKLQSAVDSQILSIGVLPDGSDVKTAHPNRTQQSIPSKSTASAWKCSDKQRDLILKVIGEHNLDTANIDSLAVQRFGVGLQQLNKVQASGLIVELMETYGKAQGSGRQSSYAGRNGR
jgi:hypothetical protein